MTRTVEIQLLPGETEVHVTVKTATVAVPKPVQRPGNPYSEEQKVALWSVLEITHFLHVFCGKEFATVKSLTARVKRELGSPGKLFLADPIACRGVILAYFGRSLKGKWPAEMLEAVQQNLDLLAGHADVLCSYELAAEVTRLKGVFVTGYTAKK